MYIFRPIYPYDFGIKCTLICFLRLFAGLVKIMIWFFLSGVVYCFNTAWMRVFLAEGNKRQQCQLHEMMKSLLWKMGLQTKNTTKNNMRSKCLPRLQKFRLSSTLYFVLWERDHGLHIALCASQVSQMRMVANPISKKYAFCHVFQVLSLLLIAS